MQVMSGSWKHGLGPPQLHVIFDASSRCPWWCGQVMVWHPEDSIRVPFVVNPGVLAGSCRGKFRISHHEPGASYVWLSCAISDAEKQIHTASQVHANLHMSVSCSAYTQTPHPEIVQNSSLATPEPGPVAKHCFRAIGDGAGSLSSASQPLRSLQNTYCEIIYRLHES